MSKKDFRRFSDYIAPTYVLTRNGKTKGRTTGGQHRCRLEDCRGIRIAVRWPGKKMTYPCSRGMKALPGGNTWQIG